LSSPVPGSTLKNNFVKRLWDPILKSAEDFQDTAGRMLDSGISFFKTKFGTFSLLSSSEAVVGGDRDETHYFLVPSLREKKGYCLYRLRVLPEGVGPQNDLPKARLFQLPAVGTQDHLTDLLTEELKDEQLQNSPSESNLANRLDVIADEIDHQINLVSGGLLLIGGVVAIANPLLGIGIAAKSLIPGLGAKLSTHGVRHASDWLRNRGKKAADTAAHKTAKAEVEKLKPEVRENKLLGILETSLHTPDGDFDAIIASRNLWDDPADFPELRLGIQAICAVYENRDDTSPLLSRWINHLEETNAQ
jgi:hypothetical protein